MRFPGIGSPSITHDMAIDDGWVDLVIQKHTCTKGDGVVGRIQPVGKSKESSFLAA
jgi:hypothetical protein